VAVSAGVDEADLGVDAFDEPVGDAEFDGVDDAVEVMFQTAGEVDEWSDTAVAGTLDPAARKLIRLRSGRCRGGRRVSGWGR